MSGNNNSVNHQGYQLVIRFNDDSADLELPVVDFQSLSTLGLKRTIRSSRKDYAKRELKLIYSGKILGNLTNFEKDILRLNKFTQNHDEVIKIYIHCLVGDEMTEEQLLEEEANGNEQDQSQQPQQNTAPQPVGFDRLLSQGFSQLDILDLRRQFQSIYGSSNLPTEDLRNLEERWIDSTVNNEIDEFQNIGTGAGQDTNFELLIGIIIGSLLGLLLLFLLNLEYLQLSKRSKMAIIAGVIVNFSFAVVRAWT